ncbi:MAG: transposase DNA-binding-containing protein [Verrucomicrobiae bacterium]|nr:transposase DNA-binding-containing protein [Verrucomicrobiae bacterium]
MKRQNEQNTSWIDSELAGCKFADLRLEKRFRALVECLSEGVGKSIPMACQDWASTKAAYRFFANKRISEADILSGHFQATAQRVAATEGRILVLHDTTEFNSDGKPPALLGRLQKFYISGSVR